MIQIVETKARLNFTDKTIEFDQNPSLADVRLIQESLANWEKWRIVVAPGPTITVTPNVNPTWKEWYTAKSWCQACGREHGNFEVCPNNATWTANSFSMKAPNVTTFCEDCGQIHSKKMCLNLTKRVSFSIL